MAYQRDQWQGRNTMFCAPSRSALVAQLKTGPGESLQCRHGKVWKAGDIATCVLCVLNDHGQEVVFGTFDGSNPVNHQAGGIEMIAQADTDWQASKSSMRERHAAMLDNDLMADVYFIVGPEKRRIPAHKYMLATGSSVFYAMFYGGLTESAEVTIPDVEPEAFLNVLRYLYCDEISLDEDNVLPTLYAAKKYTMPHLEHACREYVKENVNADNALQLLSDCRFFEETEAIQRCWDAIDNQATQVLQSDSFTDIDYQTLEEILSRDTLCADETAVFTAAIWWAKAECTRQGRAANSQNCREVLGDALYLLRFSTMPLDEFANGPGQSGLLTTQEINDIFFYHTAINKPKLRFSTTRRNGKLISAFQGLNSSWPGVAYMRQQKQPSLPW